MSYLNYVLLNFEIAKYSSEFEVLWIMRKPVKRKKKEREKTTAYVQWSLLFTIALFTQSLSQDNQAPAAYDFKYLLRSYFELDTVWGSVNSKHISEVCRTLSISAMTKVKLTKNNWLASLKLEV